MNNFEYSPFDDVYIPYIASPRFTRPERLRIVWEMLTYSPLPVMTRWIIFQAFKAWGK